jgi:small conductance mechanosensitive channel
MRRLDVSVGISYASDILLAKQIVERIYRECPLVLQEEEIEVHVDELGAHSVVIGA